jgi:carboxyl-terminal processing protease
VTRFSILLLLLFAAPAHAEPVPTSQTATSSGNATPGWNPALATDVATTALAFMAPRTLEPIPVAQLALWGLSGLTALDPALGVTLRDGRLRLALADRMLAMRPPPPGNDPRAWAQTATEFATAAWGFSAPVRKAGTEGVLHAFFDEMFNHLDPYSRYVAPREAAEDRARRTGRAGAGVTLVQQGNTVVVQAAIADGPGARAGLRPGDRILSVDEQSTAGQDATVVAEWIAGPEDTTVVIALRTREGRVRTVRILREMVPPETVFAERTGEVLVLRITGFNYRTNARLERELARGVAGPRPPSGIVLDLRGNRGGLLREAVAVADELLNAGVVATTAGRDPEASRVWRSYDGAMAADIPAVVAVDGRSASAAEIVAAALADRGRAVVVGSSTLGKGLVQTIAPLPDGGELFVTWSRVLAPLGWPIQGLGVLPQVCTSLGQDVLERQLATLDAGSQPMAPAIARHRAARAPLPSAQVLAIRNACPAAEARDADMDAARFLIAHPAAYAAALLAPTAGLAAVPAQ